MPVTPIYVDYSASTPVDERVLEAMLPYFAEIYGNPSSIHGFARQTEKAVEKSRETLADILRCQPKEIVFTSCGSESDNLAIRGAAVVAKSQGQRPHLITSTLEHSAVVKTVEQMNVFFECEATFLQPEKDGTFTESTLQEALRGGATLVSLMLANNEIGTILPIAGLAEIAHAHGTLFHTDAVQAGGQVDLNVQNLGVDMLSLSAHKFYGPKGVGLLYVRDGVALVPSQSGGSHEEGRRAGTLNVPLIVGMAKALEIAESNRDNYTREFARLRDRLIEGILARVPDAELTGSHAHRLPSHASFVFHQVDGNLLLMHLDRQGIGASSGSACKTGNPKPSSVLLALGYDESWALGGLRLSVGRHTTDAEIETILEVLPNAVEKVRGLAAIFQ